MIYLVLPLYQINRLTPVSRKIFDNKHRTEGVAKLTKKGTLFQKKRGTHVVSDPFLY
jgi:hypothetical protein